MAQAREEWERKKLAIELGNRKELDQARLNYDSEVKAIKLRDEARTKVWQEEIAQLQREIGVAKAKHHWECYRIDFYNQKARKGARFQWHAEVRALPTSVFSQGESSIQSLRVHM